MLSNSLTYKGFPGEQVGWKRAKTRRKLSFWDRNGEVLRLIKKTDVGDTVVKYC